MQSAAAMAKDGPGGGGYGVQDWRVDLLGDCLRHESLLLAFKICKGKSFSQDAICKWILEYPLQKNEEYT